MLLGKKMLLSIAIAGCSLLAVEGTNAVEELAGPERTAVRQYESGLREKFIDIEKDFAKLKKTLEAKRVLAHKKGDAAVVDAIDAQLLALSAQLDQMQAVLELNQQDTEVPPGLGVNDGNGRKSVATRERASNPRTLKKTAVVMVRADVESGTPIASGVKAGDSIVLRYVGGQWTNSGLGTASPDTTGEPQLRLAVAGWSLANNLHNSQICTAPNKTADTPFTFKFEDDYDQISLRINDVWAVFSDNQGIVRYEVTILRSN